jgi:hypothetical protein
MNSTILPLPLPAGRQALRERSPRSYPAAGRVRGHNLAEVCLPPLPLPSPVYAPQGEGVACALGFENLNFTGRGGFSTIPERTNDLEARALDPTLELVERHRPGSNKSSKRSGFGFHSQ